MGSTGLPRRCGSGRGAVDGVHRRPPRPGDPDLGCPQRAVAPAWVGWAGVARPLGAGRLRGRCRILSSERGGPRAPRRRRAAGRERATTDLAGGSERSRAPTADRRRGRRSPAATWVTSPTPVPCGPGPVRGRGGRRRASPRGPRPRTRRPVTVTAGDAAPVAGVAGGDSSSTLPPHAQRGRHPAVREAGPGRNAEPRAGRLLRHRPPGDPGDRARLLRQSSPGARHASGSGAGGAVGSCSKSAGP